MAKRRNVLFFSGEEPESLRGPQAEMVIVDEIARMRYQQSVFDTMMLGLRLGDRPRVLIATEGRNTLRSPHTHSQTAPTATTNGARDVFFLAANAQNLRKLPKLIPREQPRRRESRRMGGDRVCRPPPTLAQIEI
jgi:phage terminase large subunit-like protein